jgi:hypothetical protein
MLSRAELRKIARTRIAEARKLFDARRYDGAVYICGYGVECALKARTLTTLRWPGFPETKKEFEQFQSFRTHNLETLLSLSGRKPKVSTTYAVEWSGVAKWDPELRYTRIGTANRATAQFMIQCAERLLRVL